MSSELTGKTVAILVTDGVEQPEFVAPRDAVVEARAAVEVVSLHEGELQAVHNGIEPADRFAIDRLVADVAVADYNALVIPGGTVNPDRLRLDSGAVRFVRDFVASGKPIGVICHGPWVLIEADAVRGRRLTAWPSVRTDLRNAGADVVDEEVVVEEGIVSSRSPDDLHAFCPAIVDEFARGRYVRSRSS